VCLRQRVRLWFVASGVPRGWSCAAVLLFSHSPRRSIARQAEARALGLAAERGLATQHYQGRGQRPSRSATADGGVSVEGHSGDVIGRASGGGGTDCKKVITPQRITPLALRPTSLSAATREHQQPAPELAQLSHELLDFNATLSGCAVVQHHGKLPKLVGESHLHHLSRMAQARACPPTSRQLLLEPIRSSIRVFKASRVRRQRGKDGRVCPCVLLVQTTAAVEPAAQGTRVCGTLNLLRLGNRGCAPSIQVVAKPR
jgi:hypothetical protein